ncbi:hypothetical protein F4677DRAFT_593 [Hypoxylon crocopeplum]|nr:hypothetical protein F4677DRAFT_593 [Hypoxylon crocopeplum]
MEHHRVPRHSSSHGTLRSSYSSQGRPSHGPSPMRPLHKPLRSVNENSVLLPSPGALESMLKTTTETGDIGIFSIKPVPPSPQRRDNLSEIGQLHPSPHPSVEEQHRHSGAKKSLSCRDTTSEIISMYGSDSHKSATSTLTPTSPGDVRQRSYSMTTCGSRHLSHHKSTTTLQSQVSGGPLQRPRSPFPYPTRLKRPGVRPSSPALTESGRVDYSRMVEIDRTSYRTLHGPYKSSYPRMPRRPPPLGLRVEANSSTTSLPPLGPPPSRYGIPGPYTRTLSAASMASWSAPYRERFDSASSRTSSLTSIVNMYQRMPSASRVGPSSLSATIPRYYDYTEDFESRPPRIASPVPPLAPVPTRVPSFHRPRVLQVSDDHLDVTFGEQDSALFEPESQGTDETDNTQALRDSTPQSETYRTKLDRPPSRSQTGSVRSGNMSAIFDSSGTSRKLGRGSDIDLLPSQVGRDSIDTFNPSLDLESKDAPTYRYTDYRATATPKTNITSPERQVQVQGGGTPTIRSEQGVILRDDTQDETLHEEIGTSDGVDQVEEQVMTNPLDNTTKQRSCSDPVQNPSDGSTQHEELGVKLGFVSVGRTNSHCNKRGALGNGTGTTAANGSDGLNYSIDGNDGTSVMDVENRVDEFDHFGERDIVPASINQASGVARRQRFQRHKRNQAVLRIRTSSLPRDDNEGFPHIPLSCSTTPIVSPKPISPARQLKLKNSIPQLMKALPSLPGDPDYIPPPSPSIRSTSSNGGDYSEVLAPFRFSQPSTPRSFKDTGIRRAGSTPICDQSLGLEKHVPKFRLRTKVSSGSGATTSSDARLCEPGLNPPWTMKTPVTKVKGKESNPVLQVRTRNRLKLRSSRSTTLSTPSSATVRRNTGTEASGSVVDIGRQKPRDLFSFPAGLSSTLYPGSRKSLQPIQTDRSSAGSSHVVVSPNDAPSQPGQRTTSPHIHHQRRLRHGAASMKAHTSSDARHPHGLKKQLSNLCSLLGRTSDSVPPTSDAIAAECKKESKQDQDAGIDANSNSKHFATGDRRSTRRSNKRAIFGRRVRSKLFIWAKEAKTAVRVYTTRNRDT